MVGYPGLASWARKMPPFGLRWVYWMSGVVSADTRTQRLRTWARVGHQPSKFLIVGALYLACWGNNRWRRGWEERTLTREGASVRRSLTSPRRTGLSGEAR